MTTSRANRLTLADADRVAERAIKAARDLGALVCVAVVDEGGHPILLKRMDGVGPAGPITALAKARTAAMFRMPTSVLAEQVDRGFVSLLGVEGALLIPGGEPLGGPGTMLGFVGVAGAAPDDDAQLARTAAAPFDSVGEQASSPSPP